MKIKFVTKRFHSASLDIIAKANIIIEDYKSQGFDLTLRQLYYQFISKDWFANEHKNYMMLGGILNNARLAGLIDWENIVDRTRFLRKRTRWENPYEIINSCAQTYHKNLWENQEFVPEIWIEKDALVGVIEKVCNEWDVPFSSCRGYPSVSMLYKTSKRMKVAIENNQIPILFHLGDHDPSGIDASRDIEERLHLLGVSTLKFKRIALNMDQIQFYSPPPNYAKSSDSRYKSYSKTYDTTNSWELDALEPQVICDLIERELENIVDHDQRDAMILQKEEEQQELFLVKDNWEEIINWTKGNPDI